MQVRQPCSCSYGNEYLTQDFDLDSVVPTTMDMWVQLYATFDRTVF